MAVRFKYEVHYSVGPPPKAPRICWITDDRVYLTDDRGEVFHERVFRDGQALDVPRVPDRAYRVFRDGEPIFMNGTEVVAGLLEAKSRVAFHLGGVLAMKLSDGGRSFVGKPLPQVGADGQWVFQEVGDGALSIEVADVRYEVRPVEAVDA